MTLRHDAEPFESTWKGHCTTLSHSVSGNFARHGETEASLYGPDGQRKYVNRDEHRRFLAQTKTLSPPQALFCRLLAWTGARVSEVLALSPASFQIGASVVTFITLKRRKFATREVPIPPALMRDLAHHFALGKAQRGEHAGLQRLWPWSRVTAWRLVKQIMTLAGISGCQACPRGLRHGFGVGTLQHGVGLHLIQRWMGHARLSTTAIYMNVCGPEEFTFAERFWRGYAPPTGLPLAA